MSTEPKQGAIIGNYRLKDEVGVGGFGRVWLAEDRTTGDEVALKIPRHDKVSETLLDKYVNRELQALKEIRTVGGHPNLMNLKDSVSNDGDVILVVDFVGGDELGEIVEDRSGFGADEARDIGIDICDAMSFLHQHEIVYRDLKPDNVLLDGQRTPTIIDFTTAKQVDVSDLSRASKGTSDSGTNTEVGGDPAFKPPEVLPDGIDSDQGPWSDVYSLGKILFFMITAQKFETDGLTPSDVGGTSPSYLDEIVERATARDPTERYSSATALKNALERKDPTPPQTAELYHVGADRTYDIEEGDTIGRDDPPKTSISIPAKYVSRVHCRITRDATGSWVLEDESTNGTYYHEDGDWVEILSPNGRQKLRSKGRDVEATTDTKRLEPGDTFALVDPNYDKQTWFIFQGEN
ncbi:FHA domain-containing serine/threonine-protein kinase [Halobellus marinus]|uniref:FHA domain-containing serine/threonine-protein kinase n=1 Tax=Halobellus TaxID=1073986 RepID=UPI0028A66C86|nr:FHA domain-containing serine/threonine-protein kinase [Halobellus sp. DFY28]